DFLAPSVNVPLALPCPSVLFTHNVESEIWRRHVENQHGMRHWLYATQYERMLACEDAALQRFDGILAVSDADRVACLRRYPDARVKPMWVIPTGVDTEYFTPPAIPAGSVAAPNLVFTGSMDWLPNEDAMRFFCRDVLPLIRDGEPRTRLSIVG